MAYTKQTWTNDSGLAIDATNLNTIEQGIKDAHDIADSKIASVNGKTDQAVTLNASEIPYSNATSGITATDTNGAIDEVDARVDVLEAAPTSPDVVSNRSSFIVNTSTTLNNMNLASIQKIGTTEFLYTGTGASLNVPTTGVQIANDNGDGVTIASDWADTTHTLEVIVKDNSVTGDNLPYECINPITVATGVSPRLDTTNWKLADNQYGYTLKFKSLSAIASHYTFDSVRRETNYILTDTTGIEVTDATSLIAVNPFSVTIGILAGMNTNLATYVLTVEQTIRRTAGYRTDAGVIQNSKLNTGTDLLEKDSVGNPQIRHYNPVQGNEIVLHTGNGLAGRNITTGVKYDFAVTKSLGSIFGWASYNRYAGATKYLALNTTAGSTDWLAMFNDTEPTESTFTFGTDSWVNTNAVQYITYGYAETANTKIVSYQGTGAVGNVVDLGMDMTVAGAKVIIKGLTNVSSWTMIDTVRDDGRYLYANTSAVEIPFDHIDFTSTGFVTKVGLDAQVNTAGVTYMVIASTPYYAQPTGGKELTFNSGISVVGADGKVDNAFKTANLTTTASALLDVGTGNANTKQYLFVDAKTGVQSASEFPINSGTNRAKADTWGVDVVDASGTVTHKTTARHGSPESETGFVSASSTYLNVGLPHRAFDDTDSLNDCWLSIVGSFSASVGDESIYYDLTQDRLPVSFRYKTRNEPTELAGGQVVDFTVDFSNDDGKTWTSMLTKVNTTQITSTNTWSELFDLTTLAQKTRKLRVRTTKNGGSNYIAYGEIEFKFAISDEPYINVQENKVLDSSDLQENRVMLGHVLVDSTESLHSLVEYPINEAHSNGFTAHGNVKFKEGIEGVNQCTAWVKFDGTATPPRIHDSYNVAAVARTATGFFDIYLESKLSVDRASTVSVMENASIIGGGAVGSTEYLQKVSLINYAGTYGNYDNVCLQIFGGKK